MANSLPVQYQPEETMALVQERAKISGDRFRVHVYRRNPQSGQTMQVAGLDAATVDHIADPARWLPALLGGGEFTMHVFHSTEQPGQRIGGALLTSFDAKPGSSYGPPKAAPNIKAMRSDAWSGPMILTSPNPDLMEPEQPQQGQQRRLGLVTTAEGVPPQFAAQPQYAGATVLPDYVVQKEADLTRRERDINDLLARQQQEITKKEAEIRRIESETRLRNEMAQQNAELKNALAMMTSKLDTPRAPDTGMKDILAVLAPLAGQMLTAQQQMRSDMMKMEQENARRREEAEARRAEADAKRHEEALKLQLEILKTQSAKPGMSDEMKMLIETLKADKSNSSVDAMASMMTKMVDAVGVVSKMSINMIETVAEQMGGDPEDPVVTAIKEGTKAMMMLTQGGQSAASRIVPQPRAQQPAPQQPAQQAAQQPRAAAPAPAPVAARPAAVVTPVPQHVAALAGAPAVPVPDERSKTDLLEAAIRGKQPAENVARVLVAMIAQKEPSLQAELEKNSNNPNHVIYARLGEKWIMDNQPYLTELGDTFDRLGAEAGLFEPEGDEPEPQPEPAAPAEPETVAPVAPHVSDALTTAPAAPAP